MPFALLLALTASTAGLPDGVTIGPAPSWVEEHPFRAEADERYRLVDSQFWLDDGEYAMSRRVVVEVRDREDVRMLGTQRIPYRGSWQGLTLHHVRVHRRGEVVDALDADDVGSARPTWDAQEALYDDSTQAVVLVHDLRVGDVLDYAWTVAGEPPNERAHHELWISVPSGFAVDREHVSITTPAGTGAVELGGLGPGLETASGGRLTRSWTLDRVEALEVPDDAPDGWGDSRSVAVTSLSDWGAVSDWARPLYAARLPAESDLTDRIAQWSALSAPRAARRAVDFVQDEVRYLAVAFGPHALAPHDPERVLERRFGDCKDKSLLLVSILAELGIRAEPALVATSSGAQLPDLPPMLGAFDHVIVRIHLPGGPVWVDPTRSFEGGPLEERPPPAFRYALPITERDLVPLPAPDTTRPVLDVEESFMADLGRKRALLDVRTVHRGPEARMLRASLDSEGEEGMSEDYRDFYASGGWEVEERMPPIFSDDRPQDRFVVTEGYSLDEVAGEDDLIATHAWPISARLPEAPEEGRTAPVALDGPARVRYRLRVDFHDGFESADLESCKPVQTAFLSFGCTASATAADGFDGTWELVLHTDRVEPRDFDELRDALTRIEDQLDWSFGDEADLRAAGQTPARRALERMAPMIAMILAGFLTLFIVGVPLGIVLWRGRVPSTRPPRG